MDEDRKGIEDDSVEADQSMAMDTQSEFLEDIHKQPERRKRKRRAESEELHNTDCDCSTHSSSSSDDDTNPNKMQRLENGNGLPQPPPRGPPPRKEYDLRPGKILKKRSMRNGQLFYANLSKSNISIEVLRLLSPRTLHRTLMDAANFDEVSDFSSSIHSSMFEDSEGPPQSPPRPAVEYEVARLSPSLENPNPIEDMSSSTDDEQIAEELGRVTRRRVTRSWSSSYSSSEWSEKDKAELNNFADDSSYTESDDDESKWFSGLSTDSELSEKDKWLCTQCNAKTNSAYYRYCLRCFNIRRNWLPKRPTGKGKGKARPPPKVHRKRVRADYTLSPPEEPESVPRTTPEDERSSSRSSSKPQSSFPSTSSRSTPSCLDLEAIERQRHSNPGPSHSQTLSLKLQSTLDAPPVSVAIAAGAKDDPLCIICMGREKNSAFVHGKTAHFCCCFTCGDKILKRTGKCPICRRKIVRVVKIII